MDYIVVEQKIRADQITEWRTQAIIEQEMAPGSEENEKYWNAVLLFAQELKTIYQRVEQDGEYCYAYPNTDGPADIFRLRWRHDLASFLAYLRSKQLTE